MAGVGKQLLLHNLRPVRPCPGKSAWLDAAVPGPYTTMRTIDGTRIVEFQTHVDRIAQTTRTLAEDIATGRDPKHRVPLASHLVDTLTDQGAVRQLVLEHARQALQHFHGPCDTSQAVPDTRLTVLVNWEADAESDKHMATAYNVDVFVEALPPRPSQPVSVMLRRQPDSMTTKEGKDSKWISQRKYLEAEKGECNEVVLVRDSGACVEGTQTNFFALQRQTLLTAPDQEVLPGTIRKLALAGAQALDVALAMQSPNLQAISTWTSAFLSSTSRLVLPINKVIFVSSHMRRPLIPAMIMLTGANDRRGVWPMEKQIVVHPEVQAAFPELQLQDIYQFDVDPSIERLDKWVQQHLRDTAESVSLEPLS
ncbi:uncharacterized protein MONBRDRAFT_29646 [Monosiga brevicollis MX1]|uniref:Uncharacterized protein n=1 Tax=Monosiga brevicollis TaxID=81824 RepID=A9VBQ4_MONBE|nr:uncharacterized protein MONBRDRAFT_29646 [Monosiga brevicollis MX1]EDQ85017.1 predicted protein [Monosiga brevicollis MX1]|eukprot:XP_001750187.1 hypothetical protein [Monosiga brevicollis MX1]